MIVRKSRTRWPIAAAFAVAGLVAVCLAGQPAPALRVMTWNIAAGHGDLAKIAAGIRAAAPDVAALQEVDVHWSARSGFEDQAARLAEATGLQVRFAPIYELPGASGAPVRMFGVAILSRHPILEFRNHIIPRLSTQSTATEPEPLPGFLEAVIGIGATRVHVFNTHLDYRADPRVRVLQAAAMLERMTAARGPTLFAGDLNAAPDAAELAPLFRRLTDVWTPAAGPGFTYPADAPVRRIDYLLVSPELRPVSVRAVASPASDHLAVVADLILTR
jgi:endonuclease/exonuclease/phosphatase family metal-dependent hydrolase